MAAVFRGSSHSKCGHISGELKLIMLNVSQQMQLPSLGVCTNSPLCFPSVALFFFLDLSLQLSSQLSGRLCPSANTQVTQVLEKLMRCPESPKRNPLTGLFRGCDRGTSARHASDVFNTRVHVGTQVQFPDLLRTGTSLAIRTQVILM